jgi:hypothetical protein
VTTIESNNAIDEGRISKSKISEKDSGIELLPSTLPEKALANTSKLLCVFTIWSEQSSS